MIANSINFTKKLAPADFLTFIVYLLFIAAHIIVVWALPYFPTQDGPSHIYNLAILHDLLNGGKEWGEYFTYNLKAIPNLGFNIIAYPLLSFVSPVAAERIFLSLYIVLMGISAPLLISTFAPPAAQPSSRMVKFLVVPVIFNFTLMMGFYSYVIAVPVFLIAISMAWRIRKRPILSRLVFYNAAGVLLFFLHLIPFIFYIIALTIIAIVEQENLHKVFMSLVRQFVSISPIMFMLIFYLFKTYVYPDLNDNSLLPYRYDALYLLTNLFSFSIASFSPWQLLPIPACLLAMMILLLGGWKFYLNGKLKIFAEQKIMLFLAGTLTVIYLTTPATFGGGGYFNDRFSWVIFLLVLPVLASASINPDRFVPVIIIMAAILSICTNTAIFKKQSDDVSVFVEGLDSVCSNGDLIMLYKPKQYVDQWSRVDVIVHSISYYGIFKGCIDIGNYETAFSSFLVNFKENLSLLLLRDQVLTDTSSVDFSMHPELIAVLGWELTFDMYKKLNGYYDMTFNNKKLTLWKRR